jgi:signal transduction histidine kinase/CheY-like chemotaxis protein
MLKGLADLLLNRIRFVFILLVSFNLQAQLVFESETLPPKISLHPYASFFDAGSKELSVEDVISNENAFHFKPVKTENRDLGFTTHHFWVKSVLTNKTAEPVEYYLEVARPITDIVDLYEVNPSGKITKYRSGDDMAFADRSYCHRKNIFKIVLPPKTTQKYFIHLKSDGEVISLALMLRNSRSLMDITSLEQFTFGIFYGILAIAAILYFFFFFAIRERTFLFYSLYVTFIGLMQFALDGYFYQYIAPAGGWFSLHAVLIFAIISTFFLGRYSQVFLGVKEHDKLLNKLFNGLYIMVAGLFAFLVFIPAALPYCYPLANILGMFVLILIVVSIIRMNRKKIPVDRFFQIGIFFLIIGFVIFILNNFGQIPTSFLSQNSSKFGTGLEVIFLSLSMANLVGILKNEREEFNRLALERSEEMNDMKSYFLSNISHELRTPLNAILNLSSDMVKTAGEEEIRQNAQVIKYSSHSLLSSVNDILDFSKIEKGELKLESVNFEPEKVLEHIKNNAVIRAKDEGLDFQYTKSGNIPEMLYGDVTRLAQIVNNVISNAIKFTAEGTVKFELDCEMRPKNRARLVITISDSGVGIPKEKLNNIFGSFTQDNINNKRKFGGLGLGLYIVKTLVDMQGGTVKIQSKVDEGTQCKICIDYDIATIVKPTEIIAADEIFDLQGKNILVVEDNAINQMVIKMITKKWLNTTVVYTANGIEALEAVRTQSFDLILMDLQMPVMDGYEATIAIRKGEAGPHNTTIPIIAVTADVMETTKQTVKDIGMNDYLSKPLKNETLYHAVKNLL